MAQLLILRKADLALTLAPAAEKQGRRAQEKDLGFVEHASMVCRGDRIEWIGPHKQLPRIYAKEKAREIDATGETLLPGFVECHTHLVFAGHRAAEFEMRNQGASYQEIAAAGGGILSTMKATRAASTSELARLAQERADQFVRQGVTTLEIKSGYALNSRDELRMLEAAGRVKGPTIVRTFLGAHAIPPEFKNAAEYLKHLTDFLPKLRGKAERVDIFVEKGFFPAVEGSTYLARAKELGFQVMVHADQLTLSGGTQMAVDVQALSADHVLQVSDAEIAALAKSEVTATLLPAADLYMKCAYPRARAMIDAGVRVALATDFNPGSAPAQDLALVGLLARLEMKMTLPEVLVAYTIGAAHALGRGSELGALAPGRRADFMSIKQDWQTLFYSVGSQRAARIVCGGRVLVGARSSKAGR